MARRKNKECSPYASMSGAEIYKKWHWGEPMQKEIFIDDPHLPDRLVECGRLAEIHFWPIEGRMTRKDKIIKLNPKDSEKCYLAFDPDHCHHRLYIVLNSKSFKNKMKKDYWDNSDAHRFNPDEIAHIAGGKHSTDDYPDVEVKPLGILRNIVYACLKTNDGFSLYIHAMGEESGIRPAICVDRKGNLYLVGGDYHSPIEGITN